MPKGGYHIQTSGLDELTEALNRTAGGVKDLSKLYRAIGKKAEMYVRVHEPIYAGSSKDSSTHKPPGYMQSQTRGGGGKSAWVKISDVPYIYVQEFGGTSYWFRGPAGVIRALNRAHRSYEALGAKVGGTGHVIYKKARNPRGYFIWNVAYRLRSYIGEEFTGGIQDIAQRHGLAMDVTSKQLDIKQDVASRNAGRFAGMRAVFGRGYVSS